MVLYVLLGVCEFLSDRLSLTSIASLLITKQVLFYDYNLLLFFLFRKIVAEYEKTIDQMIGKEKGCLCVCFVF